MFRDSKNIAELRKNELELIKGIVSASEFPAYLKDYDQKFIFCNEQFSDKIFGLTKEEIIGKTNKDLLALVSSEVSGFESQTEKEFLDSERSTVITREILTADGNIHNFVEIKFHLINQKGKMGIFGLMIDLDSSLLKSNKIEENILLKTFLDYIPDEIFFKDKEKRYLKINNSMASHLGLNNPNEAVGKRASDFFPPETAEKIDNEDDLILKTGKFYVREQKRMEANGGAIKWLQFTKGPLPDEDGNFIGIFGLAKDITYLKVMEEKDKFLIQLQNIIASIATSFVKFGYPNFEKGLNFALYKFSRFLNADYASFFLTSMDNLLVERYNWKSNKFSKEKKTIKQNAEKFYNFIREQEIQSPVLIENRKIFPQEKKVKPKYSALFRKKNALIIPIKVDLEFYGVVIFSGIKVEANLLKENFSFINIFSEALNNVTENYEMEKNREAMEAELQKLLRAVEQSANLIAITDKNFRIEYANPKLLELTGFNFGDLEGEKINIIWPDEANKIKFDEIVNSILIDDEWCGVLKCINKNGEEIWTNVTFSTIRNNNGNLTNYLSVIEDITQRMQMENQLAISQKLESIGQLAAGIAHEINTPMQYIGDNNLFIKEATNDLLNYAGELENLLVTEQPDMKEKIDELKSKIDFDFISSELPLAVRQSETGISKVDKIVKAMKNFAHPGLKVKSKGDINKGIADSITISKNEWKYCAELEFEPEEDLPPVYCQMDEINQVILNMIVNAAHAIQEKFGNRPEIKGKIKIRTFTQDDFAVIEIEDNGCGIPEKNIPKIYDPFFTTKEVGKGSGQGLAIARNIIVNKHNGIINVESRVGMGTKFIIKLPFEETEV